MWRFVNLFIAIPMLAISAFPPGTQWNVHIDIAGRSIDANLFHWLFMLSLALYVPLLISTALLAVVDLTALLRNRSGRNAFNLAFFSLVSMAALYRLNDWVFSRIF
ncbi:hypothetical protein [Pseudomonas sp. MBLB4136]|uniref:hypothetical protein n=1 Tax=Pseudomonas sp. MBLB4136 TaxID=3451558 RepID=UPI003F74DC56